MNRYPFRRDSVPHFRQDPDAPPRVKKTEDPMDPILWHEAKSRAGLVPMERVNLLALGMRPTKRQKQSGAVTIQAGITYQAYHSVSQTVKAAVDWLTGRRSKVRTISVPPIQKVRLPASINSSTLRGAPYGKALANLRQPLEPEMPVSRSKIVPSSLSGTED